MNARSIDPNDPAIAKIGYELAVLAEQYLASGTGSLSSSNLFSIAPLSRFLVGDESSIVVDAVASNSADALAGDLANIGMTNIATAGRIVSGLLPLSSVEALTSLSSLAFARPSHSIMQIGQADSQGDVAQRTDVIREFKNLIGDGITVGVLSDSFNAAFAIGNAATSAAMDIASGDLPGPNNPNGFLIRLSHFDALLALLALLKCSEIGFNEHHGSLAAFRKCAGNWPTVRKSVFPGVFACASSA